MSERELKQYATPEECARCLGAYWNLNNRVRVLYVCVVLALMAGFALGIWVKS